MAEEEQIILTQNEGDRLRADHGGGLALYGDAQQAALRASIWWTSRPHDSPRATFGAYDLLG